MASAKKKKSGAMAAPRRFSELTLSPTSQRSISGLGFDAMTPVQAAAIPRRGTGFGVPVCQPVQIHYLLVVGCTYGAEAKSTRRRARVSVSRVRLRVLARY